MVQSIHQEMIKEIYDYLNPFKDNYTEHRFDFEVVDGWCDNNTYKVEVFGYHKDDYKPNEQTTFILLRLLISYKYKQVQISNIFLPDFMRYNGIGKKLISKIFLVSEKEQYELFIVDMVSSFYKRMITRGALPCVECDDAVQIVSKTKLF